MTPDQTAPLIAVAAAIASADAGPVVVDEARRLVIAAAERLDEDAVDLDVGGSVASFYVRLVGVLDLAKAGAAEAARAEFSGAFTGLLSNVAGRAVLASRGRQLDTTV